MVRIAPVALQNNPRLLWFDPGELDLHEGDTVIVSTEKGLDFGRSKDIIEVTDEQLECLKSPLKPVVRIATEEDEERIEELRQLAADALPIFKQIAAETNEDMRPVTVEYLFDGDRAVFYFEAEERIDFRDLVRKLASEFHVRVDMRQVGVRDEARLVGGIGHCGQELCCRRLGGDFNPVSIRMAKEQDLSLNPQKISGVCGRLMCCLRYEYDAYKDFKSRAPKQNAKIETPHGVAKVVSLDVPREKVTVRVEGEDKNVTFPLSAMDPVSPDAESKRPTSIGEVFEDYANPDPFEGLPSLGTFDTAAFTHESKLGVAEARHNPSSQHAEEEAAPAAASEGKRKSRRRRRSKTTAQSGASAEKTQAKPERKSSADSAKESSEGTRRRRRRRRTTTASEAPEQQAAAAAKPAAPARPRPGQKSSGLAHPEQPAPKPRRRTAAKQSSKDAAASAPASTTTSVNRRRRRRRSHTSDSGGDSAHERN